MTSEPTSRPDTKPAAQPAATPNPAPDPIPGARPAGVTTPDQAAANIQRMFSAIAPTYDRANHILSVGVDRYWWARAARTLRPILHRPEAVVLDLCCGTGDMTLALDKHRPKPGPALYGLSLHHKKSARASRTLSQKPGSIAPILAADFSHAMLALALPKFAGRNIVPIEADALHLPLADASVDLVTSAFGFRNLTDYPAGLAELYRVLRPSGQIAILDFNQPAGPLGLAYNAYFRHILPRVGGLISRDPTAYAYLPDSVARFPRPPQMKALIAAAGFTSPTWTRYTFGIAGLYRAAKP
jgi:demethylmenaquinone methyltransferase/2-methoxy-6-polyprenyl-1,4-benzoquinol methylase